MLWTAVKICPVFRSYGRKWPVVTFMSVTPLGKDLVVCRLVSLSLSFQNTSGMRLLLALKKSQHIYRHGKPILDWPRNWLLIKHPQFLPNQADIQVILTTNGLIILTEFHNYWVKIADFFINNQFLGQSRLQNGLPMSVCHFLNQQR